MTTKVLKRKGDPEPRETVRVRLSMHHHPQGLNSHYRVRKGATLQEFLELVEQEFGMGTGDCTVRYNWQMVENVAHVILHDPEHRVAIAPVKIT